MGKVKAEEVMWVNSMLFPLDAEDSVLAGLWVTQEGEELCICEMGTGHLANSVVMVWNHVVRQEARYRGGAAKAP